jgi:uncharacterized membrane protein YkoI
MASVSRQDAETIALANITRKPIATTRATLEVESGCLVWQLEFKRADKPGLIRVTIDAGDGRFLSEHYEGLHKQGVGRAQTN